MRLQAIADHVFDTNVDAHYDAHHYDDCAPDVNPRCAGRSWCSWCSGYSWRKQPLCTHDDGHSHCVWLG